jgi:hypothetical protein
MGLQLLQRAGRTPADLFAAVTSVLRASPTPGGPVFFAKTIGPWRACHNLVLQNGGNKIALRSTLSIR